MSIRVFQAATAKQLTDLKIPDTVAFLDDLGSSKKWSPVLRAHVARNNPVWQSVSDGDEVLVVFRAQQAYISPNWYPSKQDAHKQLPTWNYKVVHALEYRGRRFRALASRSGARPRAHPACRKAR